MTRDDGDGPSRKLTKVDGLIHFVLYSWFVVGVGRLDGNGTGSPAGAAARFAGLSATPVASGPWARTSACANSGLMLEALVFALGLGLMLIIVAASAMMAPSGATS